jgi:uncharacterized membrane protein
MTQDEPNSLEHKSSRKGKKADERLKAKKEQQKKIFFAVVGIIILAIIVTGIVFLVISSGGDEEEKEIEDFSIEGNNAVVLISATDDGNFHYYSYETDDGTMVDFFVVKGGDGDMHVAFDSCDVCYDAKKGYSKKGDEASCNNCQLTYKINDLGSKNMEPGKCWPGYLPYTTGDGKIYIKLSDIEEGKWRFE